MTRSHWFPRQREIILVLGLLVAVACLTSAPAPAQSQQGTSTHSSHMPSSDDDDMRSLRTDTSQPISDKQKQRIVHANFEKSKSDAAALAAMAKELREELDKSNGSVLSLEVINRAEKIEKLAKKIREETKGY